MNSLEKLLQLYPDNGLNKWNFDKLSKNQNMNIMILKKNLKKKLNWKELTRNKGIKIRDIESRPNFRWDKNVIYDNPNITKDYILKNVDNNTITIQKEYDGDGDFTGYGLSFPLNSPLEYIFKFMSEAELMLCLSKHNCHYIYRINNMSFKLLNHIMILYGIPTYDYWFNFSISSGVTMDNVKKTEIIFQYLRNELRRGKKYDDFDKEEYRHIKRAKFHSVRRWNWNYEGLSSNPNLTIDYIRFYLKNKDNWDLMNSAQWNGRIEESQTNWNWERISKNSAFTMDHIAVNSDLPWEFVFVSLNPNVTIEFVLDNLNEDWDWNELSRNEGINMDNINSHPKLPWNYEFIWANPNITMGFIQCNSKKICFDMLSENTLKRMNEDLNKKSITNLKRKLMF